MKIEQINENSPYLANVKELGRKNSKTLGFFPDGAFEEYAARRWVLVAHNEKNEIYGYLLYRVVQKGGVSPVAVIVHLCVDDVYRNKGIAGKLVDKLVSITKHSFLRLELKCRRDYEAHGLWAKIGFVVKDEIVGRGGKPVSIWEMVFRQLPLIALLEKSTPEKSFLAVIDANIFYRLQDPVPINDENKRILSEEAKALQEDWLEEDVTLAITDETFIELDKNSDDFIRRRRLRYARQFHSLNYDLDTFKEILYKLSLHFPMNPKVQSDIRQLAYTIAGNAHFFITQDTDLLKKSDIVHDEFGIIILPPGEFIGRIDEIIREVEYRPRRLGGSHILQVVKGQSDQLKRLYSVFRSVSKQEKRRPFEARIRHFFAYPSRYDNEIYIQKDSEPLALIVYDRKILSELVVPMIRVSRSPLSGTMLRYLLRRAVLKSAREKRPFIVIRDSQGEIGFGHALEECGFSKVGEEWVKCSLQVADSGVNLLKELDRLRNHFSTFSPLLDILITQLSSAIEKQDPLFLSDLERRLWPAKILDAKIPTYIISIETIWARHLFDENIAKQTLLASKEDLLLGHENVYYRSKHPAGNILSPARILWYVIYDKNIPKLSKRISACSSLDEVVIGRAKDLFRRFQRLGIYEWEDILRKFHSADNYIMALRFSNTELLHKPINLSQLKDILKKQEDKEPILQSPQRILPDTFARIYQAELCGNGGYLR